jgi:hypothetical protein
LNTTVCGFEREDRMIWWLLPHSQDSREIQPFHYPTSTNPKILSQFWEVVLKNQTMQVLIKKYLGVLQLSLLEYINSISRWTHPKFGGKLGLLIEYWLTRRLWIVSRDPQESKGYFAILLHSYWCIRSVLGCFFVHSSWFGSAEIISIRRNMAALFEDLDEFVQCPILPNSLSFLNTLQPASHYGLCS